MSIRVLTAAAAAAFALAAGGSANAAIAVGDTVQIVYLFPDTSSAYQTDDTTYTGPGTTLPIIYTGTASFFANEIVLTQTYGAGNFYSSATFNGVELSDLTNSAAFAGWGVLPGTTTAPITEYSSGGSLFVNWQGAETTGVVNLGVVSVPEAGTWAMMLVGLGMIGFLARRRNVGISYA